MDFQHVTTWIFDLDNTLYPPEIRLFDQISQRMTTYVMRELGLPRPQADRLRDDYWRRYGTTLAGLMAEHDIDPLPYLDEVHDIDFSALQPAPDLAALIAALPGRKIVHTNGNRAYALRVLQHRGLTTFDAVHGVDTVNFHPKPDARAYAAVLRAEGFDPRRAAMFEDDPRNLEEPHRLGMKTILVSSGASGRAMPTPEDHVLHQTCDLGAFLRRLGLGHE